MKILRILSSSSARNMQSHAIACGHPTVGQQSSRPCSAETHPKAPIFSTPPSPLSQPLIQFLTCVRSFSFLSHTWMRSHSTPGFFPVPWLSSNPRISPCLTGLEAIPVQSLLHHITSIQFYSWCNNFKRSENVHSALQWDISHMLPTGRKRPQEMSLSWFCHADVTE